MARKQVIKPDFTINNINAVNDDKGARALVGGIVRKPAPNVQSFAAATSRALKVGGDQEKLQLASRTNLTSLNFDGDNDNVEFSNSSDFSFIRTIEQNTINFTHDSANAKVTVADNSTLSMNKSENTVVSNFVKATSNTYYSAADTDDLSFVKTEGEVQVLNFAGDNNSIIEVDDDNSLSFVEEVNTTVATFTRSTGAGAFGSVADNDAFSFASDVQVSAVQFSANANSKVHMSTLDTDFRFIGSSSDVGFVFAFWINATSVTTFQHLFGFFGGEYFAKIDAAGSITLVLRDASALGQTNEFVSPQVSSADILDSEAGNWVHIAMVYTPETSANANDEQVQFYKNGSAWGSAVVSPNNNYVAMEVHGGGKFTLGNQSSTGTNTNRFAGMLSNFLVFKHDGQSGRSSTPLTANEVKGLYNGGRVMANYNNHPKSDDLVGYWKLDEDVSEVSQITDYSGENNHLDTIGSAVTEDSTSGLFKREDDSFTITVWIKKNSASHRGYIVAKGTSSGATREYSLSHVSRKLEFLINDNSPTDGDGNHGRATYNTNTTFLSSNTNEWEHITVVYDATTQNVTFHRNGGSAQTGTANDTQTVTAATADSDDDYDSTINLGSNLTIGTFSYSVSGRSDDFGGRMAHLAIFKYGKIANPMVATPNQVKGLYNGGFVYDYSLHHIHKGFLVGYWKMNNTTATKNSPTLDITALSSGGFTTASDSDLKKKQDTDFTVSFWVKRKGAGVYAIIGKQNEYNLYVDNRLIKIDIEDTTGGAGTTATARWQTGTDFLDNNTTNWQHVTVTYDASAKTVKFYKNGVLGVTDTTPSSFAYNEMEDTTNDLYIGRTGSGFNHLLAELAHLAIFSHDGQSGRSSALMSDAEVYKLYDRDGTNGSASSVEGKVYDLKSTHAKRADLVGYWHLDEDPSSTATITDYSGLSNDGTTTGTGTTTLTNPANSGLDSADFVDVSFSISFWMKKSSTTGDTQRILAKGTVKGTDAEYMVQRFNRRFYLYVYDNTPTDGAGTYGEAVYYTNTTFLSDNNTDWEHITIVYDASTQNATFYNNGDSAQVITAAFADGDNDYDSMFNGTGLFYIGQETASSTVGIDGQLAHLAVFKHDGQSGRSSAVPTAAQVKGGYNGGNVYDLNTGTQHPKKADIVGYWKLDGITATVGNDLTNGGGASTSTATDLKTTTDVDMTFAFWFKKNETAHSNRTIIGKNNEYQIYLRGNKVNLRIIDAYPSDGGAASHALFFSATVATNTTDWQHMVIRYDASAETAYIIVNGGSSAPMSKTSENDFDDFHDGTSAVVMGYDTWIQDGVAYGFGGQIAHLAVFKHDGLNSRSSTMLSVAQAQGLYNGGNVYDYTRHPKAGDLVGYWKLNEDISSTATITDYSGLANHGATTGTGTTTLTNPANSGLNEVKDNSFTVGFWMNKDNPSEATGLILVKSDEYNIRQIGRELRLVLVDTTDMDSNTTGIVSATTTGNFLSNSSSSWEHIIVSYDAANRQVKFFINKALHQTVNITAAEDSDYNEMQDTTQVLRIGHTSNSFDGKLSNVIMFDHGAAGLPFDNEDAEELYSDGYVYDYNNHSRASDIVAWWKLDGNGNDSHTGGSHNGTVTGPTEAANSGLYYLEDQDFAFGFFVRPTNNSANRYFFRQSLASYESYYNSSQIIFKMQDKTPKQIANSIATPTTQQFTFSYALPLNVFTHVVFSYDKSERKMHLYVNGVEQGTGTAVSDADYQEGEKAIGGTFYLGNFGTSNSVFGDMSHFVMFRDRHLTESEANELYNNGEGYNYLTHSRASDISAFYKLDETTGNNSTLADSSGNGNNLITTNVDVGQGASIPKIPGAKVPPQLPMRMSIPGLSSLRTNPQK